MFSSLFFNNKITILLANRVLISSFSILYENHHLQHFNSQSQFTSDAVHNNYTTQLIATITIAMPVFNNSNRQKN